MITVFLLLLPILLMLLLPLGQSIQGTIFTNESDLSEPGVTGSNNSLELRGSISLPRKRIVWAKFVLDAILAYLVSLAVFLTLDSFSGHCRQGNINSSYGLYSLASIGQCRAFECLLLIINDDVLVALILVSTEVLIIIVALRSIGNTVHIAGLTGKFTSLRKGHVNEINFPASPAMGQLFLSLEHFEIFLVLFFICMIYLSLTSIGSCVVMAFSFVPFVLICYYLLQQNLSAFSISASYSTSDSSVNGNARKMPNFRLQLTTLSYITSLLAALIGIVPILLDPGSSDSFKHILLSFVGDALEVR